MRFHLAVPVREVAMLHRLLCCLSPRVWCAPSPRSLCVLLCPALSCLGGVRWLLGAGSEVAPSVVRVGVRESGGGLARAGAGAYHVGYGYFNNRHGRFVLDEAPWSDHC